MTPHSCKSGYMNNESLRSDALNLLRFPLAIVIVVVHCFPDNILMHGDVVDFNTFPLIRFVNTFINGFFRQQSVPIYYFISGYVFYINAEFTLKFYKRKFLNRVRSLFVPYVFWNVVAICVFLSMYLPIFGRLYPNLSFGDLDLSLAKVLSYFWATPETNSPQNIPLWFVRNLIVVVITTPLLYQILKRFGLITLGILFAVCYIPTFQSFNVLNLGISYFYFSIGAFFSIHGRDMIEDFSRVKVASFIVYPILSILFMYCSYHQMPTQIIKNINCFVGLFFAYNLSVVLLKKKLCKVNEFLSASSFFLYVTHAIICSHLLKVLIFLLRPTTGIGYLSVLLFNVLFVVSLLLCIFYVSKLYIPNVLSFVTGRK